MKKNKLFYLIIPLLIIITPITIKIITHQELYIDKFAYNLLVVTLRGEPLTTIMKLTTSFGNTITIILLALALILFFLIKQKNKSLALLIPCNLAGNALINQILKFIFKRERPTGYRLIEMTGYSFPSGHAMVSMAFYGLLIYLTIHLVKDQKIKYFLVTLNILIITLIGISRVYLGVHYLSDVITGYSLSIIYLIILTHYLNQSKIIP